MEETEGMIVYQEQYLLDCKTFPNWDLAFADKHVRKNRDILNDIEKTVFEHSFGEIEDDFALLLLEILY